MAEYTEEIGYRGEFLESGQVEVCKVTRILQNGIVIASTNHRYVVAPGDDYSEQPDIIKAVCSAVHTPDVVYRFKNPIVSNAEVIK